MKIQVLDHGYVEFIEAWGQGKDGYEAQECAIDQGTEFEHDYERGIIEAARQSTQGSFRGWEPVGCTCGNLNISSLDLCTAACLAAQHKGDAKLLKYLFDNQHNTPFEFAGMVIEVQAPIFVFREWHRHRTQSYNEMSARYEPLPDLYYQPNDTNVALRIEKGLLSNNTQEKAAMEGSTTHGHAASQWNIALNNHYRNCEDLYRRALELGIPKELARLSMPVGHYSRMRASANLRNWLAFLTLRYDERAQWEIRQFAQAVYQIISQVFPRTCQLFVDRRSRAG